LFQGLNVSAQTYWENYELISTRQGLPHNTVQALLQDTQGFLWIGTYNGLCLYDGNKLHTFKNVFATQRNDNWFYAIDALFEDKDGNIWIGSKGGLVSCFLRKKQKFYEYPGDGTAKQAEINCFYQDNDKKIWLGTGDGRLGYVSGARVHYTCQLPSTVVNITSTASGLLVLTMNGFFNYDAASNRAVPLHIDKVPAVGNVKSSTHNYRMAVLHWQGCVITDVQNKKTISAFRPVNFGIAGNIALKSDGGCYYIDALTVSEYNDSGQFQSAFNISDNTWHNKSEMINCVIEDNSGILWLGTNAGLYKIDKRKYGFKKYSRYNVKGKLTDNYIRSIYAANDGSIWLGMRLGQVNVLKTAPLSEEYTLHKAIPLLTPDGRSIDDYTTNTFLRLKNGAMLAGGEMGVIVLNTNKNHFEHFLPSLITDGIFMVWALFEDKSENIWIGTKNDGLYIVNATRTKIYHYGHKENDGNSLINNSVWNIYEDHHGQIWLGTDKGLCKVLN
jgi:ligand-binding sensor domain-containing protein